MCWAFDDPADFREHAAGYLTEGLAAGLRVVYLAPGDPGALLAGLSEHDGFSAAVASGAAQVISLDGGPAAFDAQEQLRYYAAATEQAVAQGYAGLRVAADSTAFVLTPDGLEAFARYEHLADRYMAAHPFSGMCAFNRGVLGEDRFAQLACLHPQSGPQAAQMRLHASQDPSVTAVLAGEVDIASHGLLEHALRRAGLGVGGSPVVLDATGLEFIDHRGLYALASFLSGQEVPAVVRCRRNSPLATLSELLKPGLHLELS